MQHVLGSVGLCSECWVIGIALCVLGCWSQTACAGFAGVVQRALERENSSKRAIEVHQS